MRDPVVVEVDKVQRVPVPVELTERSAKQQRPAGSVTYGDAIAMWADDRAALDACNAKLSEIRALSDEFTDDADDSR